MTHGRSRGPNEYLLYPRSDRMRPMDAASVHRWFKRCLARAGLPATIEVHKLRHTAADALGPATGNIVLAQQLTPPLRRNDDRPTCTQGGARQVVRSRNPQSHLWSRADARMHDNRRYVELEGANPHSPRGRTKDFRAPLPCRMASIRSAVSACR